MRRRLRLGVSIRVAQTLHRLVTIVVGGVILAGCGLLILHQGVLAVGMFLLAYLLATLCAKHF